MFNRRKRKTRRPQPQASPATDRNTEFYARQATRTVRRRTFWLMLVLGILAFVVLFFKLYDLQIIELRSALRFQPLRIQQLDLTLQIHRPNLSA